MSGSSQCKSCGRPIVWAVTPSGKNHPVDAQTVAGGEWTLVSSTEPGGRIHFEMVKATDAVPAKHRYRSHFVTCPNASQHRRPK